MRYENSNSNKESNLNWYYITFGSAEHFPFQANEYVMVRAESEKDATDLFRRKYPDHTPGYANFAFIYSKYEWDREVNEYYHGGPSEVLQDYELYMVYNQKGSVGFASSEANAKALAEFQSKELHCECQYMEVYMDQIMSFANGKPELVTFTNGEATYNQRDPEEDPVIEDTVEEIVD